MENWIGKTVLVGGRANQRLRTKLTSDLLAYFHPTSELSPNYRKILNFLELRANENGGDTKASDVKLSKELGICLKTVSRGLSKLEKLGYVTRLTETMRFGKDPKRCTSRNNFYSIRVIRCNRIFLKHGAEVKPMLVLGWKTDVALRTKFSPSCDPKFKFREETVLQADALGETSWERIKVRDIKDLFSINVEDWDFEDRVRDMREMRGYEIPGGRECLGFTKEIW